MKKHDYSHSHHHSSQNKISATRRLKLIAGQIKGLEKMLEEDKYCIDIINQSLAIKGALTGFEDSILENHLMSHVVEQMKKGDKKKATKEIMSVYRLSRSQ